jgi:hypothetical protein
MVLSSRKNVIFVNDFQVSGKGDTGVSMTGRSMRFRLTPISASGNNEQ